MLKPKEMLFSFENMKNWYVKYWKKMVVRAFYDWNGNGQNDIDDDFLLQP